MRMRCQTWLSHDPPNLERAQATLERIIRDGHSAAEVVRRIRALFKEAAPVKAPLDINQIVAEVLRVLSDELRDNSIVVETELAVDLPRIAGDHVQIQQTLINLVHNATEAMAVLTDRPKSLVVRSRREGDDLLIEVRDFGVGIKDPTLVFEPFFTTKESGMGMGLSISRSIVEAHGGRIWATANEDAGTTISFTLPLASDALSVSHAVEQMRPIMPLPLDGRSPALHEWPPAVADRQTVFQSTDRVRCWRSPALGARGVQ